MLTIRNEQMQRMASARQADFEARLLDHLQRQLVDAGRPLPAETLQPMLQQALAQGQRWFRNERELARFLRLLLVEPGGWDGSEPSLRVRQMLAPTVLPGSVRLDNFERWLRSPGDGH